MDSKVDAVLTMLYLSVMEIYGLSDPETGELRYVGKTENSLAKRLSRHKTPCNLKSATYKTNWIKGLLARGSMPAIHSIQILHTVDDLNAAEIYWIKFFKDQGCRLTNGTDGGEGASGARRSPETRAKMATSQIGKRASPIARAAMSAAQKKRFEDPVERMKIAKAAAGCSLETRAKISAAKKGQPSPNKGKKASLEVRAKMSAAHLGQRPWNHPTKGE